MSQRPSKVSTVLHLWVIWGQCCLRVAAVPSLPNGPIMQLSPYFTQKPGRRGPRFDSSSQQKFKWVVNFEEKNSENVKINKIHWGNLLLVCIHTKIWISNKKPSWRTILGLDECCPYMRAPVYRACKTKCYTFRCCPTYIKKVWIFHSNLVWG